MNYKRICGVIGLIITLSIGLYSSLQITGTPADAAEYVSNIPEYVSATSSEEVRDVRVTKTASVVSAVLPLTVQADTRNNTGEVPVEISIPAIRVNAPVHGLGVTSTGNLDVPHDLVSVGWYQYGPVPGAPGNAVLDGHVDNGGSLKGVFSRLKEVKTGDDIYMRDATGTVSHFKVQSVEVYPTGQFPSADVFAQGATSILKIITCNGTFLPAKRTYDRRLIVTAALVE